MSNEEKNRRQMRDEKKAFIREQIAPGRRSSIRKFLMSALRVSALAMVFGGISGVVFCASGSYFEPFFMKQNGSTVSLEGGVSAKEPENSALAATETPSASPSSTPKPTATPSPTPNRRIDQEEAEEEKIAACKSALAVFKRTAEEFNASVVEVTNVQSGVDWFDNPANEEDVTSGVIIAEESGKYFVLTSYDKVKDAEKITVTFDQQDTAEGTICGKDEDTDLAVLSADKNDLSKKTRKRVAVARLGDSYQAQKGSLVMALGSPNGYMYSMKVGMVTGNTIEQYITDNQIELFQTDWSHISGGYGVIINMEGRILGVISQRFSDKVSNNLCTAINIGGIKSILEVLANGKKISYAGVMAKDIPEEYKKELGVEDGVYITGIRGGSPALEAGLQVGDVVVSLAGAKITSVNSFALVLSGLSPKEEAEIEIVRTSVTEKRKRKLQMIVGTK